MSIASSISLIPGLAPSMALALAMLVWVPWINRIAFGSIGLIQIVAAICGVLSLFCPPTSMAGPILAGVWLLWTVIHFISMLRQALLWGHDHVGRVFGTVAGIFLIGGAMWALAASGTEPFLGFTEPWKTLTAIHFHYSGFLLATIFALHWEVVREELSPAIAKFYSSSLIRYLIGFILIAVGLNGARIAEIVGIGLIFLSILSSQAILLWAYWGRINPKLRAFLVFLCGIGVVSMCLALAYGWRLTTALGLVDMIIIHGLLNALLWVPGLILFSHLTLRPLPLRQIPFSRLYASGRIGADFFKRIEKFGAVKTGLVDSFDEFDRPDFVVEAVDPEVQRFYEKTAEYDLMVSARPALLFRPVWFFLKPLFSTLQQLNLPDSSKTMRGSISALIPSVDGRNDPRGWMRVDANTGRTIYAAAYAVHRAGEFVYMNIAFPLPFCNMASILHVEHLEGEESGIELTSLRSFNSHGDQGVYLVRGGFAVRLPIDETIEVWNEGGRLVATHRMWIFGMRYLTLDYDLQRR